MPPKPRLANLRHALLLLLTLLLPATATPQAAPLAIAPPTQPLTTLGGPWQFHPGDNPAYASPTLDDSHWPTLTTTKGWDVQGYPDHGGFAWYRRHLHFTTPPSPTTPLALLYPTDGNNVYQAFWNGQPLATCGQFPPHDRIVTCWTPAPLPQPTAGGDAVLAIRTWAPPSYHLNPPGEAGLATTPRLGSLPAIKASLDQELYRAWRRDRVTHVTAVLYALAALLAFLTVLLNPRDSLYRWLASYLLITTCDYGVNAWVDYGGLSWEWDFVFVWLVSYFLQFVTLWFLLLRLFRLDSDPFWRRATSRMFVWSTTATLTMAPLSLIMPLWNQSIALLFRVDWWVLTVTQLYTLVLIAVGMRRKPDPSRWTVAIAATLAVLWPVIYNIFQLLGRWDLGDHLTATLSFHLGGGFVGIEQLTQLLLLLSLAYAAIHNLRQARRERTETELELRSAHEVQQVLIPDDLPHIPGFVLTSAYRPAREVGGDFFQVIPLDDGSTLFLIGDVSGKGLRAGMMVALITGAARTAAEFTPDPSALLASLNRRLHGRMQGGFVTSLALRLFPDGHSTLANAGHLAPMLNGQELPVPATLPLGIIPSVPTEAYQSIPLQLHPGDTLTLYTDGIPEARNPQGELFGFDRTAQAIQQLHTAGPIAQRAQTFGQEDDITILTIQRLPTPPSTNTRITASAMT